MTCARSYTKVFKCCPDAFVSDTRVICQDVFQKRVKTIKPPCEHHYHYKCFNKWMCSDSVEGYTATADGLVKVHAKVHATHEGKDVVQYLTSDNLMADLIAYMPVNDVTIGS
eukprot:1063962-Heterocapsa_arctica.AAC.1